MGFRRMTSLPHGVKNPFRPSGETFKGVHGRKYRELSKGEKKATPRPPSVMASRKPWEAVTTKKKKAISVMIPYSDALMLASDWYAQLWAESLGKKALAAWRRKKSRRQGLPPPAPNLTEFLETYPQRSEAEPGSLSGNVFRFC
jgi:hypothetical protein